MLKAKITKEIHFKNTCVRFMTLPFFTLILNNFLKCKYAYTVNQIKGCLVNNTVPIHSCNLHEPLTEI